MPAVAVTVQCPVYNSFRVQQIGGMFDVPLLQRAKQSFSVDVPDWLLDEADGDKGPGASGRATVNQQSLATSCNPPSPIPHPSPWQIGLIVGPSGSGKSTMARAMFVARVYRSREWPADRAVIDGLGQRPIKEITRMFTAVGFSSPPSWIKPYSVLSNGEQFRCDLARALLEDGESGNEGQGTVDQKSPALRQSWIDGSGATAGLSGSAGSTVGQANRGTRQLTTDGALAATSSKPQSPTPNPSPLVVFDEFTSVVDRNVARVVSAAIAKGIRAGQIGHRFVAVTCHYDVTEWLAPDWVIDMAIAAFSRRRLRRPPIELEIFRCRRSAWTLFKRHHYLSGEPVVLTQRSQRPAGFRRPTAAGAYDHAPVRGGKPVLAHRQSFDFAVVDRHSPILGP